MDLQAGVKFDHFTIEALLGEGGMGQVYRAFDERLHRRVALKILRRRDGGAATTGGDADRESSWILREARAAAALDHRNAVSVFELGEHEGVPFMAMEFIAGSSLRSFIRRQDVPMEDRVRWLIDIAGALGAAHRAGIVHLDVKPENVMVRDDGVVKVLDFGIARRTTIDFEPPLEADGPAPGAPALTLTTRSVLVGTPSYMAPEQVRQRPLDGRADQFSWGVVAYELLAGVRPWASEDSLYDVLFAIANEPPVELRRCAPEVPKAVAAVVMRALSKTPEQRFESMEDIVTALGAVVSWRPPPRRSSPGTTAPPRGRDVLVDTLRAIPPEQDTRVDPWPPGLEAPPPGRADEETRPAVFGRSDTRPCDAAEPLDARSSGARSPRASASDLSTSETVPFHAPAPEVAPPEVPLEEASIGESADGLTSDRDSASGPDAAAGAPAAEGSGAQRGSRRSRVGAALLGAAAVAALGAGLLGRQDAETAPTGPAAAAVIAGPAPTALTDLPEPARCNEAALTAHRAGMRALRDGSWEQALERFERATAADPGCAGAHLRLVMVGHFYYPISKVREVYSEALRLRADLGERDQLVLDAFEPLLRSDPADKRGYRERLRRAWERFPGDAELASMLGDFTDDPEEQARQAQAAIALDRHYSDAWQQLGHARTRQGRMDEALAALDACVREAPSSLDCLGERSTLLARAGRCDDRAATARAWLTRDPGSAGAYASLASALATMDRPREAVEEALRQRWARLSPADRPRAELLERALLDALSGDFDGALRGADELDRLARDEPDFEPHLRPTMLRAGVLLERQDLQRAGAVAAGLLRRKVSWTSNLTPGGNRDVRLYHAEPYLLRVEQKAKVISEGEWQAAQAAWVDATRAAGVLPEEVLWAVGWAMPAETADEAAAALRAMPPSLRSSGGRLQSPIELAGAFAGRALLLAGQPAEALPFLRAATASCFALEEPFTHTQAHLWLGEALERRGDEAGACAAYRVVERRWGARASRSASASAARARIAALACGR